MKLPILKTTLALALGLAAWTGQPVNAANDTTPIGTGNPYLPLWEHLPDGEPRVFEDPDNPGKYRAYIMRRGYSHVVRARGGPDPVEG